MDTFTFKAIGTEWNISVDEKEINLEHTEEILFRVQKFENQFSRFLPDSEVNSFRNANPGVYAVSKEFYTLLRRADILKELTGGTYDPAVGGLLEKAGYDATYSFETEDDIEEFTIPKWSLQSDSLKLDGPTTFDFGGIGKGYCIDLVAGMMKEFGYKYFMVEAGGDMWGTTKGDGTPWKIAIQYPGKYDEAVGTTTLSSEAIAVSDTFRRRWGKWNHIVNPHAKRSIENIIGAVAVAPTAFDADCMTSALFLGPSERLSEALKLFDASYLIFYANGACLKSGNWYGALFTPSV